MIDFGPPPGPEVGCDSCRSINMMGMQCTKCGRIGHGECWNGFRWVSFAEQQARVPAVTVGDFWKQQT